LRNALYKFKTYSLTYFIYENYIVKCDDPKRVQPSQVTTDVSFLSQGLHSVGAESSASACIKLREIADRQTVIG